jgi:hypothetical protein
VIGSRTSAAGGRSPPPSILGSAQLLPVIGRLTTHPDAQLRASLVTAQLIGIATQRNVIRLEPLAEATPDEIVALAGPAIEQYLR